MIKSSIKKAIQIPLNSLGFDIVRKKDLANEADSKTPLYPERFAIMKKNGFSPKVIFDCGAHKGIWSKTLHYLFPEAFYILFEPNPMLWDKINFHLTSEKMNYKLYKAAVASKKGTAELNLWGNIDNNMTGSSLCEHIVGDPTKKISCDVIALDNIAEELNVIPDLIKLDLEGFEIEALHGCQKLLKTTEMFMIEFGVLEAFINRATVKGLIDIMSDNDYSLYDVSNLSYRPYDGAMTGGDFYFVKNSSK